MVKRKGDEMEESGHPVRPKEIPMDLDTCEYGMEIDNTIIEELYDISEDDPNFSLAQMRFKYRLELLLERDHNMPCTVCVRNGILKILTHEEASEYHKHKFDVSILKMMHSFYKNRQVDVSEFENIMKKEHNRTLEIQSKVLQSVVNTHPDIKLEAHKRKTPLPLFK
jgi:hypothetical protein